MRILADENIESEIVTSLRSHGYSVTHVKETLPGAEDPSVRQAAFESDTILLTNDKDFGELVYRNGLHSNGVILLRLGKFRANEKFDLLSSVISEHEDDLIGAFTVISETSVRIRKERNV